jgi:hypothetical protein
VDGTGVSRAQDVALQPESLHFVVSYKRLDSGVFRVPEPPTPGARHVEVDEGLLDALLDGVDLGEAPKPRRRPPRVH